jgi:REP element-mobilizing transposase RayT
MWNLPAPPGFWGLRPDQPLKVYMRHLPHWRQEGATYFVTFRLKDSLPQVKLNELEQVHREWQRRHAPLHSKEQLEQLSHEIMRRVERWLDQGMGSCRLRDPTAAATVVDAMHSFDGERYELDSYVVMPNHVHAILRPLLCDKEPLERILQSWKRHSAHEINRRLGLKGEFWQEESFDRILRDEEHLWRALQYIGANPGKVGLTHAQCPSWVRPEWVTLGWAFP